MDPTNAPHPFFGLFGDDPFGAARAVAALGGVSEAALGPMRAVIITDSSVANALFTHHRLDLLVMMSVLEPRLHAVVAEGLLGANGDEWKLLRKLVTPEFSRSRLEVLAGVIQRRAEGLAADWQKRGGGNALVVAFDEELGALAREVMLEITFGHPPTEDERAYYQALVGYAEMVGRAERVENPAAAMEGFREPLEAMQALLERAIDAASEGEGLVGRLLRARDGEERLDPHQVRDTVSSILLAGIVDVQSVFAFLGHLLGTHAAWQSTVRQELALALREGLRPGLDDLPCLKATVNETLRLYPSSLVLSGFARKDVEVPGAKLSAGDLAVVVLPAMFRNEAVWPSPDAFVPQRFLRNGTELRKMGFTPFGIGMRACVGAGLAMLELQATLGVLLRDFEFEALEPSCAVGGRAGQLVLRDPIRVRVTPKPALTSVEAASYR